LFQRRGLSSAADTQLFKTALYDEHIKLGGKMVPYADYALPVSYKDGAIQSHLHCRNEASLFDVSHMGQIKIYGKNRAAFLESVLVGDMHTLKQHQARLSVLTNERGGVIDDLMVTNHADHMYMVVNGGCKVKDLAHMRTKLAEWNAKNQGDVVLEYLEDSRSLIALQGPKAAEVLQRLVKEDLKQHAFMTAQTMDVSGISDCWVSRCGYTGEDGFEVSVPAAKAADLWNLFLQQPEVRPAGLAVRDSLRLEAGLCLYGHELNEDITPVEAGLAWLINKRRRADGGFPGFDVIRRQLESGVQRKRVGAIIKKGSPARENAPVQADDGQLLGVVTSGGYSPVLKAPIVMAYVSTPFAKEGTNLSIEVRGKLSTAEVVKLPFVAARYFKPA